MKRLAIITTHPIQYYAPLFKLLHERKQIEIKVFYTWGETSKSKHDPGFGKRIEWDLPLLDGYPWEWALNTAGDPGSHHFSGIKNPGLIAALEKWKPHAVLVIGWAYDSHLKVMRHFNNKIPVYFRGDSTVLDEKPGIKKIFKKVFLKWVYRHADHVFYAGSQNKKYFLEYGVPESQLSFTPHAVDNARFAEDRSAEALELRKNLGIKSEEILVLFAGKLEPKKDPTLLLNAFLAIENKDTHLLFVGNGSLEHSLKSQISNLRSNAGNGALEHSLKPQISNLKSHTVHFMDFQNQTQMPVIYQACDLFCLPSRGPGESWGLAINEAMACGKAILASDKVGAASDLVLKGKNGQIFNFGNADDLKEKLEYLISQVSQNGLQGKKSKEIIHYWNFKSTASVIENRLNI